MEKKAAKKVKDSSLKKKPEKTVRETEAREKSPAKKDFLVVGLGASAGGIQALQEFFAAMPPDSGMAFVVILHLSPHHESNLAEILQMQTAMPVVQATQTHTVEPNCVYVIPPNGQLEMSDGVIRCVLPEKAGTPVAIDVFFRTLAEAYARNAVCVVLSGTGSDGTLGLKRVKESNGFAIVQAPEDAEFDQMPRNAIATGLADWILPAHQMPGKMIQFRESSERLHLTSGADAEKVSEKINDEGSLNEILTILRVRTGHDFTNYKKPTLVRRIARHLQIHELENLPAYIKYMRDNAKEIQSLQRNLLINVTNFFRDKDAFKTLEIEAVPRLFAGKTARDTVRVWTAGCASGEEAYSAAMLLTEYAEKQSDAPQIMVFATDIDDEAIAQARAHTYPETIETDVSPERLKRFFQKDGSRYRIKKELRETVLFAPHNVLRDPPFSKLDLITCRNLLIYFNPEAQKRVLEIFNFALNPDGFLFLGISESTESVRDLFEATDKKMGLYRRRLAPHGYYAPPQMPVAGNWQISQPAADKLAERVKTASLGEVHYKLLENLAPPSALVSEDFEVVYMSQSIGRYLRFTGGEPTNNLLKLVNPALLPDLRVALFTVQREHQPVELSGVPVTVEGKEIFINLTVRSVGETADGNFLLVMFDEAAEIKSPPKAETEKPVQKKLRSAELDGAMAAIINRLEDELQRARINLRATVEQHEISTEELRASNEELQAINEELRSATEELETSKEELQAVNEEMNAVNSELKEKIEESVRANSDLQNLISSTDIATIFLDRKLHIKRFSPLIAQLFNITRSDIERPLGHFTHRLNYENLAADAKEVLKTLKTVEREILGKDDRCFLTRFSPYRTIDDRIEGVVLNFLEITKYKRAEEALRETEEKQRRSLEREVAAQAAELKKIRDEFARLTHGVEATNSAEKNSRESEARLELILESIKDYSIITTDTQGVIIGWNTGAENIFGYRADEVIGQSAEIIFTPEDRAAGVPAKEMRTALEKGRAEDERFHLRKDGLRFYVSGMMTPLKDGDVKGFVKIARDETEAMKAEKSAREKETLRRLVAGQEDERRRIARDLHDHLGQQLTTLRLKLEAVSKLCPGISDVSIKVDESLEITRSIDADVGFLAWELRPATLDDLGLTVALNDYLREWQFHSGIKAEIHISGLNVIKLPPEIETTIYRIAQEALNNVYKHAKANSVSVIVKRQGGDVVMIVEDNGIGFRSGKDKSKKTGTKNLGLTGISERAALVGGTVEIESKKGKGTTVFVHLPYVGSPGK